MKKIIAPKFMQEVARISLIERLKYPVTSRPMTNAGVKRANQISQAKELSFSDLVKMRSFLIRHAKNFKPHKIDSKGRYTKGTISYWAWGGVENNKTLKWVEDQLDKFNYFI